MDTKTLYKISYGLYVVSSVKDGRFNGQIANTVFQITSEPATIAVSINKQNLTHEYIDASGMLSVSILSKEVPMAFIGHFGFKSGRDIDKFKAVNYKMNGSGCPIVVDHTIGCLGVKVVSSLDAGTHTIYVGEIEDAEVLSGEDPMTYAYYHEMKGGKAPKTAPTYIQEEKEKEMKSMDKYTCEVCGYVYDPEVGDPDSNIAPVLAFENLPDGWVCPICGASKEEFAKAA